MKTINLWALGVLSLLSFCIFSNEPRSMKTNPDLPVTTIFFDIGNVLMRHSISKAIYHIGISDGLKLLFTHPSRLFNGKKVFDELCIAMLEQANLPLIQTKKKEKGIESWLEYWLDGKLSSAACKELFAQVIPKICVNTAEINLYTNIQNLIFTPEYLTSIMSPVKEMEMLVDSCLEKGMQVGIISNLDAETFNAMLCSGKFPAINKICNQNPSLVIISAKEGCKKPGSEIFKLACARAKIDPRMAIFIDDLDENIAAAREYGMHTIQFKAKRRNRRKLREIEKLLQELCPFMQEDCC